MAGHRRDPCGDQHGVQAPAYLVGTRVRLAVAGGLQAEAVLDRDEVEQAALGFGDDVGPVTRGEQLVRAGPGFAPGSGMPAGAVERDGQVQGGGQVGGQVGGLRSGQDVLPSVRGALPSN